jgi:hypothetical protein
MELKHYNMRCLLDDYQDMPRQKPLNKTGQKIILDINRFQIKNRMRLATTILMMG